MSASSLAPTAQTNGDPRSEIHWWTARWYGSSMATGGVSLALGTFPYATKLFRTLGCIAWLANCLLFIVLTSGFVWRMFYPSRRLYDANEPLWYGFAATALCSIATATALVGDRIMSFNTAAMVALVIWWSAVAVSVIQTIWVLIYLCEKALKGSAIRFEVPWLGIYTGIIVASASGGVVAHRLLEDTSSSVTVCLTALALLCVSFPIQIGMVFAVALGITIGKVPMEFSSHFMLLGPTSVSGNALINIGSRLYELRTLRLLTQRDSLASLANISGGIGLLSAFACWSISAWMFLCVWYIVIRWRTLNSIVWDYRIWAFIFPNCVFAVLTTNLWIHTGFALFKIMGAILQLMCVLMYAFVACGLLRHLVIKAC